MSDLTILTKEIQNLNLNANNIVQTLYVTNLISLANNTMIPEETRKQLLSNALVAMKVKVPEELLSPAEQEFISEAEKKLR